MVPESLRKKTVPAKLWPTGQRWCAGCQSFVDLEDCAKGSAQCRACSSSKSHAAMVTKTYGINGDRYEELLALQDGKCAICRARPRKTRLAVDHDHKTGAVRGLVCSNCNHDLLGGAHDNVNILFAAVHYMLTPPAAGGWISPELRGEPKLTDILDTGKTPSKASRLVTDVSAQPRAESKLAALVPTPATVSELMLIGGSRNKHGFYRIYVDSDSPIPF